MMQKTIYRAIELFLLFVLYPISLALDYAIWLKLSLGLLGFVYVLWVLLRVEKVSLEFRKNIPWRMYLKHLMMVFLLVVVTTSFYVLWQVPEHFFSVPRDKPGLFVVIFLVYGLLSVWPQEIIFRTFFYQRYESFFSSNNLFMFVNALLFSMAHLFFRNTLVIIVTFVGGLLFARTYMKYRSTTLVCLEHALYGNWLFAVGMGGMLGFPT